ncbi:7-carboxy-7-deazaguanine synthase [Methanosarcinaceae archaeon Ag5]|uniref:7-carboxy-7-deazaguanine synthase n=1 Tax=Methanolapillus africanus TaxID=3028297 RepID=A0AAE4SEL6_9EURY|nr:7-carboxy-7-deazaguanine synthase [Methanosarcinaceae archaeon Ag5]
MQANIGGIVPLSTVDWHGRSSIVLFFNGCPFRCPYCHNFNLIDQKNSVDLDLVRKRISESKPFISAVVFLGGEPLLQSEEVAEIAKIAKEKDLLVGIHTNGYFPDAVLSLIENGLADKFFVDIKAPFESDFYLKVTGVKADEKFGEKMIANIQKSLKIIDASKVALEVKTTVFPDLVGSEEDIEKIASWLDQNIVNQQKLAYVIQQGNGRNAPGPVLQNSRFFEPAEMDKLAETAGSVLKAPIMTRTEEEGQKEYRF